MSSAWRPPRRFLVVALLTFAYPLLHKPISDVCDWASARWGFGAYQLAALLAIPVVSLVLAAPFVQRGDGQGNGRERLAAVIVLAALTIAAQHWLMVVNIELIHLPQFAIVSAAALASGFAGPSAFLVSLASGVVDETYQHLVVYAARADTYFDINDIVLNALGAAWGITLFLRDRTDAAGLGGVLVRRGAWWWCAGATLGVLAVATAWWLDPPRVEPFFRETPASHKLYRVLSAPEGVMSCVLLWFLVYRVTRGKTLASISLRRARAAAVPVLIGGIVVLEACAAARPIPPVADGRANVPRSSTPFVITLWCGPPLDLFDDSRAAEVAAAGFTVVGPPCEGTRDPALNRRALDVAARHGLKMWIADDRYDERAVTRAAWEADVDAAGQEYRSHPAFGGFFVSDEPSATAFPQLRQLTARLQKDGDFTYINLLADYVPEGHGTATYRDYLEQFIGALHPRLLSYDYYPFLVSGDRPTFFSSLTLMRELSLRHQIPFMLIVQAMPHGPYRDPTEAELAWQIFQAMAFGARGVSYFAYWTPVNVKYADVLMFRHGLIENRKPTEHYFQATRLNAQVRAMADALEGFSPVAVADSLGRVAAPTPLGPIEAIEGGAITAGQFRDAQGTIEVLLANRDYRRPARVRLRLGKGSPVPQQLDLESRRWLTLRGGALNLPPGGALLLRWRRD